MAKRPTPNKPSLTLPAPALIAGLVPALFDGLRDGYLATITWPADTDDAAKALVVEHVNGFIAHLAANAEAAGLVGRAETAAEPAVAAAPEKGMFEVVVTGPRDGRRRIGRAFTETATPPFFVTPAELADLKADPKLMVQQTGTVVG